MKDKIVFTTLGSVKRALSLIALAVFFNSIYDVNSTDLMNSTSPLSQTFTYPYQNEKGVTPSLYEEKETKVLESEHLYPIVTTFHLVIGTASMILSDSFLLVVLNYLRSISLAKECLLVLLYKDFIKLAICINCLAEISLIFVYLIGYGIGISDIVAKLFSFVGCNVWFLLLLWLNTIGSFKLYQRKTNRIDPPMPWGDDDSRGLKWTRVLATTLTLTFSTTMFGLGKYPRIYYWLSGQENLDSYEDEKASLIYSILFIFLISAIIITFLAEKFYKPSNSYLENESIPDQINYIQSTLFSIVVFAIVIDESTFLSSINPFKMLKTKLALIQVGTPIITILRASQIRNYTYNMLRKIWEELFFYQLYLTPTLLCVFMYSTLYLIYDCYEM